MVHPLRPWVDCCAVHCFADRVGLDSIGLISKRFGMLVPTVLTLLQSPEPKTHAGLRLVIEGAAWLTTGRLCPPPQGEVGGQA